MRCFRASLTAAVALLVVSTAMAQNRNFDQRPGQQPAERQLQQGQPQQQQFSTGGQASANLNDMQIAAWLSAGNRGEIAAGHLAEQHATNQQVRDLAKEMIKQHTDFGQHLMRFAGGMANQQAGTQQQVAGQPANQTLTSSVTGQAGTVGQSGTSQGLNFIAVIQQMDQNREQALSRDLGEKHGAEFDKCYVGQQIGAHMEMLDKIRVLRQYASPQLQQVLAQGEQTTQHHLDQFKQVMKSLESNRS